MTQTKQSVKTRRELFARAYIIDLNATSAAIKAGYSEKTAKSQGNRLLTNADVKARVAKLVAEKTQKLDISADRILEELAKLGFSNMLDYLAAEKKCSICSRYLRDDKHHNDGSEICLNAVIESGELSLDFSQLTREQAAAIQEYTVDATGGTGDGERKLVLRTRFKLADKTKALELLGKYRKLFTERVEVTGLEGLADMLRTRRKAAE